MNLTEQVTSHRTGNLAPNSTAPVTCVKGCLLCLAALCSSFANHKYAMVIASWKLIYGEKNIKKFTSLVERAQHTSTEHIFLDQYKPGIG